MRRWWRNSILDYDYHYPTMFHTGTRRRIIQPMSLFLTVRKQALHIAPFAQAVSTTYVETYLETPRARREREAVCIKPHPTTTSDSTWTPFTQSPPSRQGGPNPITALIHCPGPHTYVIKCLYVRTYQAKKQVGEDSGVCNYAGETRDKRRDKSGTLLLSAAT